MQATYVIKKGTGSVLDLFGPTVAFLNPPGETGTGYCVMLGTIPAGISVPLHRHPDVESFFLLSGNVQVLSECNGRFEWVEARPGDFVQVPANAKHAFRNASSTPAVQLITTTPTLGNFLREVGRPHTAGQPSLPPTPDDLQRLARVVARYRYWLGSPEENAAVGISLFG